MPVVPKRRNNRQVTTQAPSPRSAGLSNVPGGAAFGAVGADLLSEQSDVMAELAQEELERQENQERVQLKKDLADFQIESIQRVDEIAQNRDPDQLLSEQVMADFEERKKALVERQPNFLKPEATVGLLPTQVNTARSAIVKQEQINREETKTAWETTKQSVLTQYSVGNLTADQAVAKAQDFQQNVNDSDQREQFVQEFKEDFEALQLTELVGEANTLDRVRTVKRQLSNPNMLSSISPTRRTRVLQALDDRAATILTKRKNLLQNSVEKVQDGNGAQGAIDFAEVIGADRQSLDQLQQAPMSDSLRSRMEAIAQDPDSSRRSQAFQQLVQSDLEARLVVQKSLGVQPGFERFLAETEAESISTAIKSAAMTEDTDGFIEGVTEAISGPAAAASKFTDDPFQTVANDVAALSGGNPAVTEVLLDLTRRRAQGENIATAPFEAIRRQFLDEDFAGGMMEQLEPKIAAAGTTPGKVRQQVQAAASEPLDRYTQHLVRQGALTEDQSVAMQNLVLGATLRSMAGSNEAITDSNIRNRTEDVLASFGLTERAKNIDTDNNNSVEFTTRETTAGMPEVFRSLPQALLDTPDIVKDLQLGRVAEDLGFNPEEVTAETVAEMGQDELSVSDLLNVVPGSLTPAVDPEGVEFSQAFRNQVGVFQLPHSNNFQIRVRAADGTSQPLLIKQRDENGNEVMNAAGDPQYTEFTISRDKMTRLISLLGEKSVATRGVGDFIFDLAPGGDPIDMGPSRLNAAKLLLLLNSPGRRMDQLEGIDDQ